MQISKFFVFRRRFIDLALHAQHHARLLSLGGAPGATDPPEHHCATKPTTKPTTKPAQVEPTAGQAICQAAGQAAGQASDPGDTPTAASARPGA